jgi:general secretion pathway protein I
MNISRAAGFTLIEIMVALGITAFGITAVSKVVGNSADMVAELENRMLAGWVASNRMSELRLDRRLPSAGTRSDRVEMGGRTWRYEQSLEDTEDPDIYRVEIAVYLDDDQNEYPLSNLMGFLARRQVTQLRADP